MFPAVVTQYPSSIPLSFPIPPWFVVILGLLSILFAFVASLPLLAHYRAINAPPPLGRRCLPSGGARAARRAERGRCSWTDYTDATRQDLIPRRRSRRSSSRPRHRIGAAQPRALGRVEASRGVMSRLFAFWASRVGCRGYRTSTSSYTLRRRPSLPACYNAVVDAAHSGVRRRNEVGVSASDWGI